MKYKAFGLVWNLKPVVIALWMGLALVLSGWFLTAALSDSVGWALFAFWLCTLWVFITNTLEANGKLKL